MDELGSRLQPLRDEANALLYVLHDLDVLESHRSIPAQTSGFMRQRYRGRLDAVYSQSSQILSGTPASVPISAYRPSATPGHAQAPEAKPPSPSLKHLAADNAILLVSSIGGALLIFAALLFELYGAGSFGQWVRFGVVAGVTAIFGVAARLAWRREALRIVGKTYLAVFALLVPITAAAAYEFLPLREAGLTADLMMGIGGVGCALLYTVLGIKISSREYSLMGLSSAVIGWSALSHSVHAGEWWGPSVIAAAVVVSALGRLSRGIYRTVIVPFEGAIAAITVAIGLLITFNAVTTSASDGAQMPWLAAAAWLTVATVAIRPHPIRHATTLFLLLVSVSSASLLTGYAFGADVVQYAIIELCLGVASTVAAVVVATPKESRSSFLVFGWFHLATAILLPYDGTASHAVVGAIAVVASILPPLALRNSRYTYAPSALLAVAWYWIVPALVPAPPNAGPSTLALAYSPLPFLLVIAAGILRLLTRDRDWSLPAEVVAGAAAVFTLVVAASSDQQLATIDFLAYGALAYAASVWDNEPRGIGIGVVSIAVGAAFELHLLNAPAWALPLTWSFLAAACYVTSYLFAQDTQWNRVHRMAAIAVSIAASTLPALQFNAASWSASADMSEMISALLLAVLVFTEGQFDVEKPLFWVATGIVALATDWIPASLSAGNPQAYVVVPALAAIFSGWTLMQNERPGFTAANAGTLAGFGVAALLGTTVLQSLSGDAAAATYAGIGVFESILILLAGISFAHRATVTAAGAALAVLGLHALYDVVQTVPLYAVFAVAAATLLALGALMATSRTRVEQMRDSALRSWASWH